MRSIWIFGIVLNLFANIFAVPIEVIYTGDGCDRPSRLNYKVAVPQLPTPQKYIPNNYDYKVDAPPIQAKAKVSYTFDFSVEEPKPPCRERIPEKLNLLAKVDRIALQKPDCPNTYVPPPPPLPAPAPCNCGRCGITKPFYRYVNGKLVQTCKFRRPKCQCNLRCPNSMNIENSVLVARDPLERNRKNVRRKRDLERVFFRPRRQEQQRSTRFVKLYHKPISVNKDKESWLDMDMFSDANPFKRKTKKVFFPAFRSRIVKRDIKGEYDLLEKDRQEMDLTIPEIIQFMPETLHPDFKRGPCQFGCRDKITHISSKPKSSEEVGAKQKELYEANNKENIETTAPTTTTITPINASGDDDRANNLHKIDNTFTKRNANGFLYQAAGPPIRYPYLASQQTDYIAKTPSQNPFNPQRNVYAPIRSAPEPEYSLGDNHVEENDYLRLLVSASGVVPDPFRPDATPLQYTGDLEIPQINYNVQRIQDPTVGSANYPVQHISSDVLDRIISDIVYRHPDFIEATTHYGGALVDPEPEQAEQTKDFIKKLIDGRFGLFFDEPLDEYTHYYPVSTYRPHVYNPYYTPKSTAYHPAFY